MPREPIVYHDDILRSGADSSAVLIPTSLVEATFQKASVVVEMSKALMAGRLTMPAEANKSGKDHRGVILPMSVLFECCALTRERERDEDDIWLAGLARRDAV